MVKVFSALLFAILLAFGLALSAFPSQAHALEGDPPPGCIVLFGGAPFNWTGPPCPGTIGLPPIVWFTVGPGTSGMQFINYPGNGGGPTECQNGLYSHSAGQGTCSQNGGIQK